MLGVLCGFVLCIFLRIKNQRSRVFMESIRWLCLSIDTNSGPLRKQ